ncbi:uncharacterized protein CDAR_545481 [Caerostris darwini]|uniref:Gustatory receptor n=1 Tax=Caerostris darwini TaxID=1538125 RepID=A0AAV4RQP8_9ARAC|nr:uncharacterized protein CDAR_545481 [Caerostris darwini]
MKTKGILELIRILESIKNELSFRDYERLLLLSKVAAIYSVFVICVNPAIMIFRVYYLNSIPLCLKLLQLPTYAEDWYLSIAAYEIANTFTRTSIKYAVVVFYGMFCYTFSLCLQDKKRSKFQAHALYNKVLQIVKKLEERLSLVMLIIFSHILVDIFQSMLISIEKYEDALTKDQIWCFLNNMILAIFVVFSAEKVQKRANGIRESLFTFPNDSCHFECLCRKYTKISEDHKQLKLTLWEMFTINKLLLFSMLSWNLAYAVIIVQF